MNSIEERIVDFLRLLFVYDEFDHSDRRLNAWLWAMGIFLAAFCGTCALLSVRNRLARGSSREAGIFPVMTELGLSPQKCCQGVLATGATGGGKTSVLKLLEQEIASTGCGILHLSVKTDEPANARLVLQKAGRGYKEFRPGISKWNPLVEELSRPGGSPESMAQLLEITHEIMNAGSTGKEQAFWGTARKESATHSIAAVSIARRNEATLNDVYEFLLSAPSSPEQLSSEVFKGGACCDILQQAKLSARTDEERRRVTESIIYFCNTLAAAGEKVYGATVLALAGQLALFVRGPMYDTTTTACSNISTLDPCRGECVVMDCAAILSPAYQQIQILFGLQAARAALRRPVTADMPIVAIFQDEAQFLMHPLEQAKNQTLARSQKLASFIAVQNLPVLYEAMSDPARARSQCMALCGNLVTKLFMSNTDHDTMEYFSELTGKHWKSVTGGGQQPSQQQDTLGVDGQFNFNFHHQLLPRKLGSALTTLKTGGEENGFVVEGYVHMPGRRFNGLPFKKFAVKQDLS